jgi:hypothetical protein
MAMNKPAGVVASAVVAIIGSVFTILMAVVILATVFIETPQSQTPGYPGVAIGSALMLTGLAGLGIWTAIGLLRLRPWARVSILVFAGFMAVTCVLVLVMIGIMPIPPSPGAPPEAERIVRPTMYVMFGIPVAIAVWWLIQFNTRNTRAAFEAASPAAMSRRPLSISIIGWISIVGGASCLFPILARTPAFLAGATLTGWSAGIVYAFFGALSLYIGWGLLDLRERARRVAIAWFALSFVHMAVVTLVPTFRRRMLDAQVSIQQQSQTQPLPFDMTGFAYLMLAVLTLISIVAIAFLLRHRSSFETLPEP